MNGNPVAIHHASQDSRALLQCKFSEAFPVDLPEAAGRTRLVLVGTHRAAWWCVRWERRAWAAATGSTPGTQPRIELPAARRAYDLPTSIMRLAGGAHIFFTN